MVPFRVYDREHRAVWIVLNYHPGQDGGAYLLAREDDSDADGDMTLLPAAQLARFRLVDFLEADDETDA